MVNSTVEVKNINCNNYYIETNCTYQWEITQLKRKMLTEIKLIILLY